MSNDLSSDLRLVGPFSSPVQTVVSDDDTVVYPILTISVLDSDNDNITSTYPIRNSPGTPLQTQAHPTYNHSLPYLPWPVFLPLFRPRAKMKTTPNDYPRTPSTSTTTAPVHTQYQIALSRTGRLILFHEVRRIFKPG